MNIEFTLPRFKFAWTKPIFTIKYSDAHQIISTTSLFRFIYLYFRTLFTKDKYIKISDKYSSVLARPTICTTIINDSKSDKVGNLSGSPKSFEYCPNSPISTQHALTPAETQVIQGIWENPGAIIGLAKFESSNETDLPFPVYMLSAPTK